MKKSLFISLLFALIFLSACAKAPTIENVLDQTWSSDTETGASCSLNSTWDSSCDVSTWKTESSKSTWETVSVKTTWDTSFIKKDVKWFAITSTAFVNKWKIPVQYSCMWKNINPSFEIQNAPKWTQSFAMIVYDPDAQSWSWVHRIIWNFSINSKTIDEWKAPLLAVVGKNSRWKTEYRWPCTPNGTHRYFFKLYAMDTNYGNFPSLMMTVKQFEDITKTHILWTAEIYWTYSK